MTTDTETEMHRVAASAGWNESTLLLLTVQWIDDSGASHQFLDYLEGLATDEEDEEADEDGEH
jgi:hypothetical protein